jgi:hypothetical protein
VEDLRSELAASVRDKPPAVRKKMKKRDLRIGDMVTNVESEAELERLFELLGTRERQGRFDGVPIPRLAQALVPFADPFVFLGTPRPSASAGAIPIDQDLDTLLDSKVPMLWGDELAALMSADLEPAAKLIAGVLRTFSHTWDVMISVDHVVALGRRHNEDGRPAVLNGRSSLVFEHPDVLVALPGARNQEWLTRTVGGLLPFVDASLDFFPGGAWKDRLSWEPDTHDPLIWKREGRRVAWFERVHGRLRSVYGEDFVYRQPTVSRWVCTGDEWKRLEAILGSPERRVDPQFARQREP